MKPKKKKDRTKERRESVLSYKGENHWRHLSGDDRPICQDTIDKLNALYANPIPPVPR